MEMFALGMLGVLVVVIAYLVVIYNRLVRLRNRFKNAFAQIDVQLRRRYDLIPNLVEAAKAYLKHERETLARVTEARNQALAAAQAAGRNPGDAGALQALAGAEAQLGQALLQLQAVMESYPDLKANQTIAQLMEELTSTENRVAFARQAYNDAVMRYNTQRESFPDVLVAQWFGFPPAALWELDDANARAPVQVRF